MNLWPEWVGPVLEVAFCFPMGEGNPLRISFAQEARPFGFLVLLPMGTVSRVCPGRMLHFHWASIVLRGVPPLG